VLYSSNKSFSRRTNRLFWAPLPAQPVDNPVRRYLDNRSPDALPGFLRANGRPRRSFRPAF
jgi:hypothetical protein